MIGYKTAIVGIAAIPLIPALLVGGGFVFGGLIAVGILLVGLGGPKIWQLHNNKSLGAKGRNTDVRDYMSPSRSSNDNPQVETPHRDREDR